MIKTRTEKLANSLDRDRSMTDITLWSQSTGLANYDNMIKSIATTYSMDEVKEIHDKVRAAEIYAQQAKNIEAERLCCEIRLRAERRAGQLLSIIEKAKASPGNQYTGKMDRACDTTGPKTLADMGISKEQSHSWQRLAAVPEEDFEAALSGPKKPSTTGIVKAASPPKTSRVDDDVLWLWGTVRDFKRHNILTKTSNDILSRTPDFMQEELLELAPIIGAWLKEIGK